MKYSSIEEWVSSREADTYDFVEDTQTNLKEDLSNDFHDLDSYEKFFIYKYVSEEKRNRPKWNCLMGLREQEVIDESMALKNAKKFVGEAEKYQIGDPDSESRLLQNIYSFLWGNLTKKPFMWKKTKQIQMLETGDVGALIASDTMTSAMVRFTDAMKAIIPNNLPQDTSEEQKKLIDIICEIHDATLMKIYEWYNADKDGEDGDSKKMIF